MHTVSQYSASMQDYLCMVLKAAIQYLYNGLRYLADYVERPFNGHALLKLTTDVDLLLHVHLNVDGSAKVHWVLCSHALSPCNIKGAICPLHCQLIKDYIAPNHHQVLALHCNAVDYCHPYII